MSEQEWLASNDPAAMLRHVEGKISDRRLRLFACGCARQVWDKIEEKAFKRCVVAAELYADGLAKVEHMQRVYERRRPVRILGVIHTDTDLLVDRSCWSIKTITDAASVQATYRYLDPSIQAALLREIIGNPWRPVLSGGYRDNPPVQINGADCRGWLTWHDGTVPKLAQAIYEDRKFEDMPILADALEDAGCDNEELLRHCRGEEYVVDDTGAFRICEKCNVGFPISPAGRHMTKCPKCGERDMLSKARGWIPLRGPHVRGCWVLDLLLGKQ